MRHPDLSNNNQCMSNQLPIKQRARTYCDFGCYVFWKCDVRQS